ncbi:MAG: YHYH protein [Ascidiaceihabitans sp.]|nr:YHYH protein [Ascidiaceihabitans sp.]
MSKSKHMISPLTLVSALVAPAIGFAHPDLEVFHPNTFAEQPVTVDCTLENGTAAVCYEIEVNYQPAGVNIGPFCPTTVADKGGIWDWTGENSKLYRVDETFLRMLADLGYRFFDDDGAVHTVDIATERPAADHACINVSPDDTVKITMRLPVTPLVAETPSDLVVVSKIGVALDGAPIFSDAPSIQDTGHMPALDTCGGHIDPGGWYHWHATSTDIETVFAKENVIADCALTQDSSAQFGYAFDGFPMFGSREMGGAIPTNLDACGGHVGQTILGTIYHYHASEGFPNLPPCLVGVQAQDNFSTTAQTGIGAVRIADDTGSEQRRPDNGGPRGIPPGFDEAAATLGVTTEELMRALENPQGGRPDLAKAAKTLSVSESRLREILPPPPGQ